jgi:hypothetical protein
MRFRTLSIGTSASVKVWAPSSAMRSKRRCGRFRLRDRNAPVIGLPREFGVHRKLLARFPYAIVFVESDTFVRVISVMHGHRRPAYWHRRL